MSSNQTFPRLTENKVDSLHEEVSRKWSRWNLKETTLILEELMEIRTCVWPNIPNTVPIINYKLISIMNISRHTRATFH